MLYKIKVLITKYRSFIAYSLAGVINSAVDLLFFTALLLFGANIVFAQATGYASGLISSFFLNKYFTFKNNARSLRQVILFLLVNGVTMLTSMVAIWFFHVYVGIQEHIAKLFIVTPIVMLLNYSGLRYLVFVERNRR